MRRAARSALHDSGDRLRDKEIPVCNRVNQFLVLRVEVVPRERDVSIADTNCKHCIFHGLGADPPAGKCPERPEMDVIPAGILPLVYPAIRSLTKC